MKEKRIYCIKSKTGKKTVFYNASSKNAAARALLDEYFDIHVATHSELMEQFKTPGSEITDVPDAPIQTDIESAAPPVTEEEK